MIMSNQISIRESGDITILDVRGKITIEGGSGLLGRHLKQSAASGVHKFLLNLADTTQVDSSGLNIILETYVSLKKRGGDLKLLSPRSHVLEVLRVLRLPDVIPCFGSEAEGLASFNPRDHAARP
jgi:anti-anti-sigma factor